MFKYCLVFVLLIPITGFSQRIKKLKKKEKQLIEAGMPNDTMRVLLTTNTEDSLQLREESRDVNFEKDEGMIIYFSKRLKATMLHPKNRGVGIAAPQVGLQRNIICVQRFGKEGTPLEILINPKIVACSDSIQLGPEGCLSIPDAKGEVERAKTVTVDYMDLDGKKHIEVITDFDAVIVQHEIDHLRGILFIDHLKQHEVEAKP